MTIEEQAAQAGELKATGQCNCTQSVLCPCLECVRNAVLALGAGWAVENMKQACRKQPF